jgi:hypothetical protein
MLVIIKRMSRQTNFLKFTGEKEGLDSFHGFSDGSVDIGDVE